MCWACFTFSKRRFCLPLRLLQQLITGKSPHLCPSCSVPVRCGGNEQDELNPTFCSIAPQTTWRSEGRPPDQQAKVAGTGDGPSARLGDLVSANAGW